MSLNDSVLPENVLNEEEQALNSLIPEKSKGRRYLSEIIETFKQWQDLNFNLVVGRKILLDIMSD
jgi:hypothetical protein